MNNNRFNLARAATLLLLTVLTSTVAWADEETFAAPELSLGDLTATSAQIQCSLNGGEAWDLRYRVVAEGEHTMRWSMMMELTDRSFTLENLHPDTEYEVQARSIYNDGDDFSDWTPSLKFTTGEGDMIDDLDDDEAPSQVVVMQTSARLVILTWKVLGKETRWNVFYREYKPVPVNPNDDPDERGEGQEEPGVSLDEWTMISDVTSPECTLTSLLPNTAYEIMVEPVYDDGTTGPTSPVTVLTTPCEDAEPLQGVFSVGSGKQVCFSKGNLNYYGHNGGEWSFAGHQYDVLGEGNLVTILDEPRVNDKVDLFLWSNANNQYGTTGYSSTNAAFIEGAFVEWGENANLVKVLGSGWQTLSQKEWSFLLCERPNATQRVAYAIVNDMRGLILLPDEWTTPTGISLLTASENGLELITEGYGTSYVGPDGGIGQINTYNADQWTQLEGAGAVFLPAAGFLGTAQGGSLVVASVNNYGCYWSSSSIDSPNYDDCAFMVMFKEGDIVPFYPQPRQLASAVRLVKPVSATAINEKQETIDRAGSDGNHWYDMSGRRLTAKPTKRGIYISRNKKHVIQ